MKNTLENKAKFFALYWGQEICDFDLFEDIDNKEYLRVGNFILKNISKDIFLKLKPLSSITDEDAFEVAKIVSPMLFKGNGDNGGHYVDKSEEKSGWISVKHKQKIIMVDIDLDGYVFEYHQDESYLRPSLSVSGTDYLRSRGYAVPWMGLSVEKLLEYGWIKLNNICCQN